MDFDEGEDGMDTQVWIFIGIAGLGSIVVLCLSLGGFIWWVRRSWREIRSSPLMRAS